MQKCIPILVLLIIGLIAGCGGDDNGTGNGDTGPPRVVANTSLGQPPSIDDPNDVRWDSVGTVTIGVAQGAPKIAPEMSATVPPDVKVQAAQLGEFLYLRLKWQDGDHSTWPNYYSVTDTGAETPNLRPIEFTHEQLPPAHEDQAFVMFKFPESDDWDVWNWRVLTTGAGRLAEGYRFINNALDRDDDGSKELEVAPINPGDSVTLKHPRYLHKMLSAFEDPIFYITDTVWTRSVVDTLFDTTVIPTVPPDTLFDTVLITPLHTRGWTKAQKVPSHLIDSSVASESDDSRGSRWDIRATDAYNNEYTLVMRRKLNTGYADDLNLLAVDSVQVKIGFLDNQEDLMESTSNRGFSQIFWLIF